MTRKMIITMALPYANGTLHLGHAIEAIQTDIFYRFQKMRGHECYFICGSDNHGTPIMLKAEQLGEAPEDMVKRISYEHQHDYQSLGVHFDSYHSTHSPENHALVDEIYLTLQRNGDIEEREVNQAYDEAKNMFLPDRFVKGTCPKCKAADQYGDSCEACGTTYSPTDMINPVSVLSGTTPVLRSSLHFFFKLSHYPEQLKHWMNQSKLQPEVANKLEEWFEQGLQDWDISRDAPYFGFEIPDAPGKYYYVWMDAPIGYLASFSKLCQKPNGPDFASFWKAGSHTELYHFIGKDITYFHALFWPAVLMGSQHRTPTGVFTHGFLTVNGQKMSKSRGTFIKVANYCQHLNPEYLRYYFAAKLSSGIDDIDLNFDDFTQRVNADLVGKVVNIASRCAGFIHKRFNGELSGAMMDAALWQKFTSASEGIAMSFEAREYSRAIRDIMALADLANQFIDEHKPWSLAKDESKLHEVQAICSMGLNMFKVLMTYLKPVLPEMSLASEQFLNIAPLEWRDAQTALLAHKINAFTPLMTRVEADKIKAMLEAETVV